MPLSNEEKADLAARLEIEPEKLVGLFENRLPPGRADGSLPEEGYELRRLLRGRLNLTGDWFGKALLDREVVTKNQAIWLDEVQAHLTEAREMKAAMDAAARIFQELLPGAMSITIEKADRYTLNAAQAQHQNYPFPEAYDGWDVTVSYRKAPAPQAVQVAQPDPPSLVTVAARLAQAFGGGSPRYSATLRLNRSGGLVSYRTGTA